MNNIVLKGRLTHDPELFTTKSGKEYVKFSIAVNRRFKRDETDFFNCTAWGKTGVFVATYFKKGQEIILSGSMQCSKYQDDDGTSRNYWEVNVNEVEFCGSRKENENQSYSQSPAPSVTPTDFDEVIDDDDLPF